MKHVFIVLIGMASMQGCNASQMIAKDTDILFTCAVDAPAIASGRVILNCSASNVSGKPVRFLPWNTPLDSRLMGRFLDITSQDGEALEYQGMMVKRAAPIPSDYIKLQETEVRNNSLDLTISYDFNANNSYTISYSTDQVGEDGSVVKLYMPMVEFSTGDVIGNGNL
ncbi:MAG: hypothetical protein AAF431_05445 [Pseudomonadota bacterium]